MSDAKEQARQALDGIDPIQPYEVVDLGGDDRWLANFGVYAADSILANCNSEHMARFFAAAPTLMAGLLAELERMKDDVRRQIIERDNQYDRRNIAEFERDIARDALQQVREWRDKVGPDGRFPTLDRILDGGAS